MSTEDTERRCGYCGKVVGRPKGLTVGMWRDKPNVYCSQDHFRLARRCDKVPTMLSLHMIVYGIKISQLKVELDKMMDVAYRSVVLWCDGGVPPSWTFKDSRVTALMITKALLKIDYEAIVKRDTLWDYRRLLRYQGGEWNCVSAPRSNKSVLNAYLGGEGLDLEQVLEDNFGFGSVSTGQELVRCRDLIDRLNKMGGSSRKGTWQSVLNEILKNKRILDAKTAVRVADVLEVCGRHVDYRSLLNEVSLRKVMANQIV